MFSVPTCSSKQIPNRKVGEWHAVPDEKETPGSFESLRGQGPLASEEMVFEEWGLFY